MILGRGRYCQCCQTSNKGHRLVVCVSRRSRSSKAQLLLEWQRGEKKNPLLRPTPSAPPISPPPEESVWVKIQRWHQFRCYTCDTAICHSGWPAMELIQIALLFHTLYVLCLTSTPNRNVLNGPSPDICHALTQAPSRGPRAVRWWCGWRWCQSGHCLPAERRCCSTQRSDKNTCVSATVLRNIKKGTFKKCCRLHCALWECRRLDSQKVSSHHGCCVFLFECL